MRKRGESLSVSADGAPALGASGPHSETGVLDLAPELLSKVVGEAVRLGAGNALSRTCRAFSTSNLLHASIFSVHLNRARCNQLLTPRVLAALRARSSKLAIALESEETELLAPAVLAKIGRCGAVTAVELCSDTAGSDALRQALDGSLRFAQCLLDSFPGLTALTLRDLSVTCSGLASMLSHPHLSQQLQQLSLLHISIVQACMPVPGATTLATLFDKVKLKQLSFDVSSELPLPDLQPLAQHLTQLHIGHSMSPQVPLSTYAATLGPVAQLQVLTVLQQGSLEGLTQLLRALPRLHTLQLPDTPVKGQQQLEALLAATQLTSVQLDSVQGLGSCCDDLPCAWQKLELQGSVDCSTATYLPLHSLNQPLVLGKLDISAGHNTAAQVVAAVSHLTQACKVPVKIKGLELNMYMGPTAAAAAGSGPGQRTSPSSAHGSQQLVKLQELVAVLLPLASCFGEVTVYNHHGVCAECVAALAPLLQGCTCFHLVYGSLNPTLEFWRQLVQLIPTISHVTFTNSKGVASAAMSRVLRQMAEQPWARRLHITIYAPSEQLPKCCKSIARDFGNSARPAKFRVSFKW